MKTEKYSFTKEELAAAFNLWAERYVNTPDQFEDHIEVGYGERQADYLIRLLTEIQSAS